MKKLSKFVAILLVLTLMVSIVPARFAIADCEGKGCGNLKETVHCGPIGPAGQRLCVKTTFPVANDTKDVKGLGIGEWRGREPLSNADFSSNPTPTGYQPQPFHKRDCIKTLSCLVLHGYGRDQ